MLDSDWEARKREHGDDREKITARVEWLDGDRWVVIVTLPNVPEWWYSVTSHGIVRVGRN